METNLTLYNKVGMFEQKKFIYTNDFKLKVNLVYRTTPNVEYFAKINDKCIQILNKQFEIELNAGVYNIIIVASKNGEEIKTWVCDELIIEEINNGVETLPQIENLTNKVNELDNTLANYIILVNKLTDKVDKLKKTIEALEDVKVGD